MIGFIPSFGVWELLIILIIFLFPCCLFGFIGMMIGKQRGRSSIGFVLGFFLWIIGLIIILLIPKDSEESSKILKSRYVKGEITKEQFDQMKKDLEG